MKEQFTPVYLSKKGMKDLKKSISKLERSITAAQTELRELEYGTSHEDRFERIGKLSQIESLESELTEKRHQLANAKILPRKRDTLKVVLGSVVDLIDTNGRIVQYTLVESIEANPSDGRISVNSPLGQSLIGRKVREIIEWGTESRINQMRLVSIH